MRYLLGVLLVSCATMAPLPKLDSHILDVKVAAKTEPIEPHVGTYYASFSNPKRQLKKTLLGSGVEFLNSAKVLVPGAIGTDLTLSSNLSAFNITATNDLLVQGGNGITIGHAAPQLYGSVATSAFKITTNISAANAGATTSSAAISLFPQQALDATDWVFSIGTAANAASLFNVAYNGNVTLTGSLTGATTITANTFALNSAGALSVSSNAMVRTAPTISSGFGSSPSIATNNGTAAFTINVGTGGVATSGVIGLPAATNGWVCQCNDIAAAVSTSETKMSATSTTSCTVSSVSSATGVAVAWAASEILHCIAMGR